MKSLFLEPIYFQTAKRPKFSNSNSATQCNSNWLSNGRCSFFHPNVGVQKPWTSINRSESGRQENRGPGAKKDGRRPGGQQESLRPGGWQESRKPGGRQEARRPEGWQEARRPERWEEARRPGGWQESRRPGGWQEARGHGGRQEARGQGGRQQGYQSDREMCRFDGRCERIPNCPYIHSLEDFPPLIRRKQVTRRN